MQTTQQLNNVRELASRACYAKQAFKQAQMQGKEEEEDNIGKKPLLTLLVKFQSVSLMLFELLHSSINLQMPRVQSVEVHGLNHAEHAMPWAK